MALRITAERPGDEDAIAETVCKAFESDLEAHIVSGMRLHYPAFDRRFSLVAWDGDDCVGHALFTPTRLRLLGEPILALGVGPVAVVPERQRQGIGGQLMRHGHELGKREGFALAFLVGHPEYYPHHGYKACYGFGEITVDTEKLPSPSRRLFARPVQPADLPWLAHRFAAEWADVDFAPIWGATLAEWTAPGVSAVLWCTEEGERAAYMLWKRPAQDPDLARDAITQWRPTTIAHHPSGWLARQVLDPAWGRDTVEVSPAAMACELRDGVLDPYLRAVNAGLRPPGSTVWPMPFLVC